jgi:peptidoglycan/xylan/chitin deacetylase (PgdA/CDA1 family)
MESVVNVGRWATDSMNALAGLASLTIDLDGVRHYRSIHGLEPQKGDDPFLTQGLDCFLDFCADFGIPATLFVVTEDLQNEAIAQRVRRAANEGHEIACHSHCHDYSMSRWNPSQIGDELARSIAAIEGLVGQRPIGFRAPGYNLSETLLDAIETAGFSYDSSLLPSPAYWGARGLVIALKSVGDRPSASLVGNPKAFLPQRGPFRPKRKTKGWRSKTRNLVELPMTAPMGLPWIGTTVVGSEHLGWNLTRLALRSHKPIDLELHPIDVTPEDSVDADLRRVRRDLQVPFIERIRRLRRTVERVAGARRFVPLAEVAHRVGAPGAL